MIIEFQVFSKDLEIVTTKGHPFLVNDVGWVLANKLVVGDRVKLQDGKVVEIFCIKNEKLKEPIKVYNFDVEDWHTYYVSSIDVLVHNANCGGSLQKLGDSYIKKRT